MCSRKIVRFTEKGLRSATLFQKETLAQAFSCEFCEIFKKTFLTEHLRAPASAFAILMKREELLRRS